MKYFLRIFLVFGLSLPAFAQSTIESPELAAFLRRNGLDIDSLVQALAQTNPHSDIDYRIVLTRGGTIGVIRIDAVPGDFLFATLNAGRLHLGPVHNYGEPFHARRNDFNFRDVAYMSDLFRVGDEEFEIGELEFHEMPVSTLLEPRVVLTDLALHYGVTTLNERSVRRRIEPAQADPVPVGAEDVYESEDSDEVDRSNRRSAFRAARVPLPRPATRVPRVVEQPQTPAQIALFLALFGVGMSATSSSHF